MTTPVIIEDYDPLWPERFEILRARSSTALGPLAAAIEHIGSTAVPGLAAKPIIDLDILLRSDADMTPAIAALASLGYEHHGDLGIPGRETFRAPRSNFPQHVYVCLPSSREYTRHVAFRDHLRTHPEDATAYADLKRTLAAHSSADRDVYTRGKTEFVEGILRRAERKQG